MTIPFLLLAAGPSSRMGQPKMLLPYAGKTLLTHVVDEALTAATGPVYVVTGAAHEDIATALQQTPVKLLENKSWPEGMASSIRRGIRGITANDKIPEAVIIGVCDQPHVSAGLLQTLLEERESTGKGIIACQYADTIGTPVLFDRKYFDVLLTLQGAQGAKKIIQHHPADVASIAFAQGSIDVDTPDDYQRLHHS